MHRAMRGVRGSVETKERNESDQMRATREHKGSTGGTGGDQRGEKKRTRRLREEVQRLPDGINVKVTLLRHRWKQLGQLYKSGFVDRTSSSGSPHLRLRPSLPPQGDCNLSLVLSFHFSRSGLGLLGFMTLEIIFLRSEGEVQRLQELLGGGERSNII